MVAIGVRELKNKLSEYLRRVERGETVLVTDHGEIVAQLAPPPLYLGSPHESEWEALERLARQGRIRLGRGQPLSATAPPLPPPSEPIDLQAILHEMRKDRDEP